MAKSKPDFTLTGEARLKKKLKADLVIQPVRNFLNRWGVLTSGAAKTKAPNNQGQLRGSLTHELDDTTGIPTWARAGTNIAHGPWMEGGTGLLADLEGGKGTRHWPPGPPLDDWATKHGFASGQEVANIIGRRGGLVPRRFLRGAFEETQAMIPALLAKAASEIEQRAEAQKDV